MDPVTLESLDQRVRALESLARRVEALERAAQQPGGQKDWRNWLFGGVTDNEFSRAVDAAGAAIREQEREEARAEAAAEAAAEATVKAGANAA